MADKAIGELTQATQIYTNDLFVLSQSGVAKQLTGQLLMSTLASWLQGNGGIKTVEKTGTSGLVDTYTITYANNTTSTFTVTNGAQGDPGINAYVHIKYSANEPASNIDMTDTPSNWMGIYWGTSSTPPTDYTAYKWYKIRGDTGNGISSIVENADYTFTINFTDGTSTTTSVLQGPYMVSMTAPQSIVAGQLNTYTINMSDGSQVPVQLYAGLNGAGAGDMIAATYDPNDVVAGTTGGIPGYVAAAMVASGESTSALTVTYSNITALLAANRAPYILIGGTKVYQFALISSSTAYFVCPNRATDAFDWISVTSANAVASGSTSYITSIPTASTEQAGIVQLYNGYNSSSSSYAATANAVKSAYDSLVNTVIPEAIAEGSSKLVQIDYTLSSSTSLPVTIQDSDITSSMVVVGYTIGTLATQTSDWTVSTSDGSLTISGSKKSGGSTTIRLVLSETK